MLSVVGLAAGYDGPDIVSGIEIAIGRGEMVALVGANGAGKTTLVRALAGLLPARRGRIAMHGRDVTALPPHQRPGQGLAFVLENRNLFTELSVRENLRLAARTGATRPRKFDLDRILALFPAIGEKIDVRCDLLSGGQQQMVAIARALLLQPDVVVMDEPSTGLAPKVVKDILLVLSELKAEGLSILLIEQNIAIASSVTGRAYVTAAGRVVTEVPAGGWGAFLEDGAAMRAYLGGDWGG